MSSMWSDSDSDDGNSCGNEEGEGCAEEVSLGDEVILVLVLLFLPINFCVWAKYTPFIKPFLVRIGILRSRSTRYPSRPRSSSCDFPQIWFEFALCCCLGPLPVAIVICRFSYRSYIERRRQAERQRAVDLLQRLPDQRMWHTGGWLIMMRARRQRSLARSKGWPARSRKLEQFNETNIINHAIRECMGDLTFPEMELPELVEARRSKMNFVRAVMAMVELNEEVLFRHIITYL